MSKIIVITGPTATGKTVLGALLAKNANGEVVSADSMQVYKHMDIGTAKPTFEDMQGIRHHMLDIVPPWEDYSVSRYVQDASVCVEDILRRDMLPVIVGGTGLYIESLCSGRVFSQRADAGLRKELEDEYDRLGGHAMLEKLAGFDRESAAKFHANDKRRIIRAFEVFRLTGTTISQHNQDTQAFAPRYNAVKIALTFSDRAQLYSRIDSRIDAMVTAGLEREVRGLLGTGLNPRCTSMQAIGYKEMADAVLGRCTVDEAVEKIKMESRRYAKRQLSWLRRDQSIKWIEWDKTPDFDFGLSFSTKYL